MNLAVFDVGQMRIEKARQRAQHAALRLSSQAQQYEVVTGENCINDLRDHGIVVAYDSREERSSLTQFRDQIVAHLVFHSTLAKNFLREVALAELTQSPRQIHVRYNPPGETSMVFDYTPGSLMHSLPHLASRGVMVQASSH